MPPYPPALSGGNQMEIGLRWRRRGFVALGVLAAGITVLFIVIAPSPKGPSATPPFYTVGTLALSGIVIALDLLAFSRMRHGRSGFVVGQWGGRKVSHDLGRDVATSGVSQPFILFMIATPQLELGELWRFLVFIPMAAVSGVLSWILIPMVIEQRTSSDAA